MRKHFYKVLTLMAACAMMAGVFVTVPGATRQQVDMIVLETEEAADEDVPVDLSWKTAQDKGRWIEDMEIAGDATSLILIINNLEGAEEETVAAVKDTAEKVRPRRNTVPGNSRLAYYVKTSEDEWQEVFAVNCAISGGQTGESSDIYGVYRLESAFGSEANPGSLVPYKQITPMDYWTTDTEDENFGQIVTVGKNGPESASYVKLEDMKAFSNYGMILKPEAEGDAYPALVLNCQQAAVVDKTFPGIQLSETYVRMLIQSIDPDTRIMIAEEVEDLEGM